MSDNSGPHETDRPNAQTFEVEPKDAEKRLDLFLVERFPDHSRTQLSRQIKDGHVTVNEGTGRKVRPGLRLEAGDVVSVTLAPRGDPFASPEDIPLEVLHEDDWLLAIDKPPGLTVHPGRAARSGTLANALAFHFDRLSQVSGPMRPGIVHRLDKDTSGVMLVAKDDATHEALARQFRQRTVRKEYHAVVKGVMELDADLVTLPLGRHRSYPTRMGVRLDIGRAAETRYEVLERFAATTWVLCRPRTGRTHQIRVHLGALRHPIVGDRLYGGVLPELTEICPRQALHAHRITFRHPHTDQDVTFEAPLPADIRALIEHLRG